MAAEAALAELELAKRRGDVVEIATVMEIVSEQLSACRTRLLAIPSRVAAQIAAAVKANAARDIIERAIRDVLGVAS